MTSRERIDGGKLSDEKARELLFYLIGFFQLEENPRFDRAIEMFFDGPLKTAQRVKEIADCIQPCTCASGQYNQFCRQHGLNGYFRRQANADVTGEREAEAVSSVQCGQE